MTIPTKPEKNSAQNGFNTGESTNKKSTKSTTVAKTDDVANFAKDKEKLLSLALVSISAKKLQGT